MTTKLSAEAERGAQRGGRGGLAVGGCAFGKTRGSSLVVGGNFEEVEA